jgi:hypothetical protein
MGRLSVLRPEVVLVVLLVLAVGTAAADEVVKLRTSKVTLFSCTAEEQQGIQGTFAADNKEVARSEARPGWPVLSAGPSKAGRLVVKVGEELYCVRAYAVETNAAISAEADCGTMVAAAQPRSGATRGLGNNCKPDQAAKSK